MNYFNWKKSRSFFALKLHWIKSASLKRKLFSFFMFKHLIAILCLSKYQLFIKQKNVSSSNVFAFDKGYAHHFFKLHSFRFEQTSHLKFLRLNSAKNESFKFSWLAYSMLFIVSIFALLEIMKERMKKMSCVFNIWRCLVIFTLITLAAFFVIPFLN